MDTLANALNAIKVAELAGRNKALVRPASKMTKAVLELLKSEGYIQDFEVIQNGLDGEIAVHLKGKINNCKVIKPRFPVKNVDWEKYERRFLPAQGLGMLAVATPQGIMTHVQAKEKHIGGRVLAFVY